jgi:succinoglycan biosynthesis protein ExoM
VVLVHDATVVIVHLDDVRVLRAVRSVLGGTTLPAQILIADGGSRPDVLDVIARESAADARIQLRSLPGLVAQTRAKALGLVRTSFVAFLDSDEIASPGWLRSILGPLESQEADFVGGPTRSVGATTSGPQRYLAHAEARLNALARQDLRYLAGGNIAWRTASLRAIGGFDAAMGRAGEDYDANLRASQHGLRGRFIEDAWVDHDQSHLSTYRMILRRKHAYFVGAALAYLKNGELRGRGAASARGFRPRHWVDLADLVLKPIALLQAYARLRRGPRSRSPRAGSRPDPVQRGAH